MLSQSQLAMLRKEALVVIGFNISSSPRLIDVLLSLDVHVVHKVMWAGIHRDSRACRTLSIKRKKAGRLMLRSWFQHDLETLDTLETVPGVLQQTCNWHFVQENAGIEPHGLGKWLGKSKSALFYLKSGTGMAKEAVAGN